MQQRPVHPTSLSRRVFLAQGALALSIAPAFAQTAAPDREAMGPAPLAATDQGPGFAPDGAWILGDAEVAALPVVTAAQVRPLWLDGRATALAMIDARWHRDGRRALRGGIRHSGWVDWAIDPATQRWGFAGPIDDRVVKRDRWLVLLGEGPEDPAPALATSLLLALGFDRAVWMRDGLAAWNKPRRLGVTPLG